MGQSRVATVLLAGFALIPRTLPLWLRLDGPFQTSVYTPNIQSPSKKAVSVVDLTTKVSRKISCLWYANKTDCWYCWCRLLVGGYSTRGVESSLACRSVRRTRDDRRKPRSGRECFIWDWVTTTGWRWRNRSLLADVCPASSHPHRRRWPWARRGSRSRDHSV